MYAVSALGDLGDCKPHANVVVWRRSFRVLERRYCRYRVVTGVERQYVVSAMPLASWRCWQL